MIKQKTIGSSICSSGVGLHSGEFVNLKLNPAPADHGIVFVRTDKSPVYRIAALAENISSGQNASTLGVNGTRISTVEHLLAALVGMGVDNVEVELDGPEVPILDGSAGPFVEMIKAAGIAELDKSRKFLAVKQALRVRVNGSFAEVRPSRLSLISCTISFPHPLLQHQSRLTHVCPEEFEKEIASARTFGFLEDVEKLWAQGLARGGSLDNVVVLDEKGPMNEGGFRWSDECVRHKTLDLLGDLALLGRPLLAEVTAHKSGHHLTHELIHELMKNPDLAEVVEVSKN